MVHRLVSLPLTEKSFNSELQILKYLAHVNGISINIDKLVRKKIIQRALNLTTSLPRCIPSRKEKWVRLPYLGTFSSQLNHILRQFKYRPAFYNTNTLKHHLCALKDPIPKFERSGVYKISCSDCPAIYIGETERQLKVRIGEHVEAFTSNLSKRKSAFAEHLLQAGHTFDRDSTSLLHVENSYSKRRALEDFEIERHRLLPNVNLLNRTDPAVGIISKIFPALSTPSPP